MKYLSAFILSCFLCMPVLADKAFPNGVQVGVGASLIGGAHVFAGYYNPDFENYWLQHFGARIGFSSTEPLSSAIDSAIDSFMRDGVDVGDGVRIDNGKLDAWHTMLMLDYYPFAGTWRLSGGYVWGNMDLATDIFGEVSDAPSQRFYFYLNGDHYYYNGNDFDGHAYIDWGYHGPYIGTGVDIGNLCGFGFFVDFGVVFANRPAYASVDIPHQQLYIYNSQSGSWAPVTVPALDKDIAAATLDANRKLSDLKFVPMIKVGFLYRF